MPQQSILDARLAEIDRRLRTIQSGLAPPAQEPVQPGGTGADSGVADTAPPAAGGALAGDLAGELAQLAELISQLRQLTDAHERLLATSRQLLTGPGDDAGRQRRHDDAPAGAPLRLAAGPFPDTIALRRFERALAGLPEVRAVTVREYAGEDRVIVDVHLSGPTS